jgi:hypothetical protein
VNTQGNELTVSIQDCSGYTITPAVDLVLNTVPGSPVHELTIKEPRGLDNEVPPFSPGWQSFMWAKLALIVFLAASWMYEHIYVGVA